MATVCGWAGDELVGARAAGVGDTVGAVAVPVGLSVVTVGVAGEAWPPEHATAAPTKRHANTQTVERNIAVIGPVSHFARMLVVTTAGER